MSVKPTYEPVKGPVHSKGVSFRALGGGGQSRIPLLPSVQDGFEHPLKETKKNLRKVTYNAWM